MSEQRTDLQVKTINNIYNYVSLVIIALGVGLFYTLKINMLLKWLIVVSTILVASGIFLFVSPTGLSLHHYLKETWNEVGKVVWPTRKEAMQFTWIVFIFVLILGLFLWLVDTSLSWLFYNIILGRNS